MPLKINLYHEVIRTKKQEQYDPLRLSLYAVGVILIALAGYYVLEMRKTSLITDVYRAKQAEFDKLRPQEKTAKDKEAELSALIAQSERFEKRIEQRFYWAPVFEQITAVAPANVQFTKMSGDISNDAARKGQIVIEGLAAGDEPRRVAEELRLAFSERLGAKFPGLTASFKSLEDGSEKVPVDGKKVATALFSIALNFQLKTAIAEPPPAQPAAKQPAKQIAAKE